MNTDQGYRDHLVDHLSHIRRIVARVAKDAGSVDDLAQECCVRIIEKEKLFSGDKNKLKQWMNMISRNLTFDQLNKNRKTQSKQKILEEDNLIDFQDKLFSEDHIQWVLSQFVSLPPMQKNILQLKYFKGMKIMDIASKLNMSQPLVTYHHNKALKVLKQRAKAQGFLALLLPWNWNWNSLLNLILLNTKTQIASLLIVLAATTYGGMRGLEFIYGSGSSNKNNKTYHTEKNNTLNNKVKDNKKKVIPEKTQLFGKPVNGLVLGLSAEKTSYTINEGISFKIQVKNLGKKSVQIPNDFGKYILRGAIDPQGNKIRWKDGVNQRFSGKANKTVTLKSGTFHSKKWNSGISFSKPGIYKFWITFIGPSSKKIPGLWTGTVTSNEIEIVVKSKKEATADLIKKATKGWKIFGNKAFTFEGPSGLIDKKPQGIDSLVGRFTNQDFIIGFDYGWYGNAAFGAKNKKAFKTEDATVNGKKAKLGQWTGWKNPGTHPYVCSIKFDDVKNTGKGKFGETKLTFWVAYANPKLKSVARKITKSIKFK